MPLKPSSPPAKGVNGVGEGAKRTVHVHFAEPDDKENSEAGARDREEFLRTRQEMERMHGSGQAMRLFRELRQAAQSEREAAASAEGSEEKK